jgi:hypothetical protein
MRAKCLNLGLLVRSAVFRPDNVTAYSGGADLASRALRFRMGRCSARRRVQTLTAVN